MNSPLDEKALAAARDAFEEVTGTVTSALALRGAIRAYISATVLPDGLDASLKALANVMEGRELRNFSTPSAVLLIRQAQSALAAMRVERDEALKAEQDWQEKATYEIGGVPHFWKDRAAAAESQVQRLTEENEGLAKDRDSYKGMVVGRERLHAANLGVDFDDAAVRTAVQFIKKADAAEARIKALEEALTGLEFSCDVLAGTRSVETYLRMVDVDKASEALSALDAARRTARATLNSREKAE